jgi:hypothetical protein
MIFSPERYSAKNSSYYLMLLLAKKTILDLECTVLLGNGPLTVSAGHSIHFPGMIPNFEKKSIPGTLSRSAVLLTTDYSIQIRS